MTQYLAGNHSRCKSGSVYFNERAAGTRGALVEESSDHFFSDASLTPDQNRSRIRSDAVDRFLELLHRGRGTNHSIAHELQRKGSPELAQ